LKLKSLKRFLKATTNSYIGSQVSIEFISVFYLFYIPSGYMIIKFINLKFFVLCLIIIIHSLNISPPILIKTLNKAYFFLFFLISFFTYPKSYYFYGNYNFFKLCLVLKTLFPSGSFYLIFNFIILLSVTFYRVW